MSAPGACYALADREGTRTFDCGDYVMVLNPLSWDTHAVSLLVYLTLEALRSGPKTPREIVPLLGDSDIDSQTLLIRVEETLAELERIGIVTLGPELRTGTP